MEIQWNTTKKANRKSIVFFDWQLAVIDVLEETGQTPIGSRKVCEIVNRTHKISRASVINFLSDLHERDLIHGVPTSGKGGKRLNYVFHRDRQHFDETVCQLLLGELFKEYGDRINLSEQLLMIGGLD